MDFEELQQSWRKQPLDIKEDHTVIKERITNEWSRQQRQVTRRNVFTTVAFTGVLITISWVYVSFHAGHTAMFGASLLFMAALMLVYLWTLWRGVAYQHIDHTLASTVYIDNNLKKLYWRRKTITTYTWIYSVLLWLAFMFYVYDVTYPGSMLLRISAPLIITAYIFGMQFAVTKKAQKKQLKKIDALIADMQQLKENITE
jgi:hypothetical protein